MPEVKERLLPDVWDERWLGFAASMPQANIFHHPAWISLLSDCYGYRPFVIAVHNDGGETTAGLPMMEVNSLLTSRRWISLPFTDHCAPLYRDAGALGELIGGLVDLSHTVGTPRIELRGELPSHPAIQSYSPHVLHTIELSSDVETVADRIHSMHRRNIRIAERKGVRIELGRKPEHLRTFYDLHILTRRYHGVPVQPRKFFDLLGSRIIEQGLGFVLLAYKDDQCLAGAVFLHWRQTLTYKYGASSREGLSLRPNNLLFWTAIRWGCENGYRILDMGRTGIENTGLRDFKSRWGAEERPLIYSLLSAEPPKLTPRPLMQTAQTVIRKSPVWVGRMVGELLYKHFA